MKQRGWKTDRTSWKIIPMNSFIARWRPSWKQISTDIGSLATIVKSFTSMLRLSMCQHTHKHTHNNKCRKGEEGQQQISLVSCRREFKGRLKRKSRFLKTPYTRECWRQRVLTRFFRLPRLVWKKRKKKPIRKRKLKVFVKFGQFRDQIVLAKKREKMCRPLCRNM